MNKLVKGSIAGAAGVALLLGGAGTFAVWNDTVSLTNPNIQSGQLSIDRVGANGNGKWMDGATDVTTKIADGTYRIVPGTTLKYTERLNVTAIGDNLSASLTVPALSELTTAQDLAPYVTTTLEVNDNVIAGGEVLTFTSNAAAQPLDVEITLDFVESYNGAALGQLGQNSTLDLSDVTFTLTQTI